MSNPFKNLTKQLALIATFKITSFKMHSVKRKIIIQKSMAIETVAHIHL